jgi:hypothetical protein
MLDGEIELTGEQNMFGIPRDGRVSSQQLDRDQLVRRQLNRWNCRAMAAIAVRTFCCG